VVEPELFASLRPPTYSGALAGFNVQPGAPQQDSNAGNGRGPGQIDPRSMAIKRDMAKLEKKTEELYQDEALKKFNDATRRPDDGNDLRQGVQSAASAEKLGEHFQYAINHAVTLPRQKSALLPIVTQDVETERVSIYNEATHARFPLLGVVFKNTTGMHLTQGPITVYEGSTYAGDARIQDLQKGERRLLSYAIDLGTEAQTVTDSDNGKITTLKAVKGVVQTTTKLSEKKTYTVANRSEQERALIVEHPNRTDFTLTTKDKPWETARDVHRFRLAVPAGKTVPFTVAEERVIEQSYQLTNLDDDTIRVFLKSPAASAAVKKALESALELRAKLAATQREIQQVQQSLNVIAQDQDRLRKNLKEMPPEAEAYKRYLKKFDDQETEIENLHKRLKQLQEEEHSRRKEYEQFLAELTVE
jgi:hypothetical protein